MIELFRNNEKIEIDSKNPKGFEDALWNAHLNEEVGTLLRFGTEEIHEAVLVPYSGDWFGHFIEAVSELPEEEVSVINFDYQSKSLENLIKEITASSGIKKFVLADCDDEEMLPYYFLISKEFYEEIHKDNY